MAARLGLGPGLGRPFGGRRPWLLLVTVVVFGSLAGALLAFALGILDGIAVGYFAVVNAVALLLFRPRKYPGRS
jgi:hypothetical protein